MERFRPGPESVQKTSKYGRYMAVVRTPVAFGTSGSVAKHEASHVVASRGRIRRASIIPEGDALGVTEPAELTAAGAAAAAADGHEGFSWDQFLTENYLGVSFEVAKAGARAEMAGKDLEKEAVASVLQRKGVIFQADVDEAYRKADKVRKGIATVVVTLIDPQGKMKQIREETNKSTTQIIDELEEQEHRQNAPEGLPESRKQDGLTRTERDQALFEKEAQQSGFMPNETDSARFPDNVVRVDFGMRRRELIKNTA